MRRSPSSPSRALTCLRLSFAAVWLYSLVYDVQHQPRLGHDWYIYKLVMLTNLNFLLTTVYSVFSALSSFDALSFLRPAVDFTLFTSLFPAGLTTCGLFWGLHLVDPQLVMPDWVARLIPLWLNHVTHSLPIFYLLFELASTTRDHPERKTCLVMSSLMVAFYLTVILFVRAVDGYWLYPLLSLLEVEHFLIGYVACVFGFFALCRLATSLSSLFKGQKSKAD